MAERQPELVPILIEVAAAEGTPVDWCDFLARDVYDRLRQPSATMQPSAGTVINPLAPTSGATGSPGQIGAAPNSAPASTSSVSLGLAGTPAGPRLLASLSFNPLAVASVDNSLAFAQWSRFWDVSILVPMDPVSQNVDWGVADYVGIRSRLNLIGPAAGEAAYQNALEAYSAFLKDAGGFLEDVTQALRATDRAHRDVGACAQAIESNDDAMMTLACSKKVPSLASFLDASMQEWKRSGALVNKKDLYTFGLDLRVDVGDPTFSHAQPATSMMAGVAGSAGSERVSLNGRVAVYYRYGWQSKQALWALDGALALGSNASVGEQRMNFSLGAEGRYAPADPGNIALYGSNYLAILVGTTVPVAGAGSLGVGLTLPIIGNRSPQLALRGDFLSLIPK